MMLRDSELWGWQAWWHRHVELLSLETGTFQCMAAHASLFRNYVAVLINAGIASLLKNFTQQMTNNRSQASIRV